MKTFLFALLIFSANFAIAQKSIPFYVSSHSDTHPAGIALYRLDTNTGAIKFIKEFSDVDNSAYLAISNNGQYLYTIRQDEKTNTGIITSFLVLDDGESLFYVNERSSLGSGPCYVSISNDGAFLLTVNYRQGNVSSFRLENEGLIGAPVSNIYHMGSSVNKERQSSPHPHMIYPVDSSNMVVVPDLGTDKINLYALGEMGNLEPAFNPYVHVEKGAGPRHFVAHPTLKWGYVVNELNATVTSFEMDTQKGNLKEINTVSVLPETFSEFNKSADIHITPDGQYIYASNRGHNSLALLKVDQQDGSVEFIKTIDCGGDWPRAFAIDPSGKFVLVANKNNGNIVSFEIDYSDGDLKKVSEDNSFIGPQCIKFLNIK